MWYVRGTVLSIFSVLAHVTLSASYEMCIIVITIFTDASVAQISSTDAQVHAVRE